MHLQMLPNTSRGSSSSISRGESSRPSLCCLPLQDRQFQPLEGQPSREDQLRSLRRLRERPAPQTDHEALRRDDQETNNITTATTTTTTNNIIDNNIPIQRQHNIILLYANTSYDKVFNSLSTLFSNRLDIVYSAGQLGGDT